MGTVVRFRKESSVQYIDTLRKLVAHTIKYIGRLPKSTTFTIKNPVCEQAMSAYLSAVRGNSVNPISTKGDFEKRRGLLTDALSYLDTLECLLAIVAEIHYDDVIGKNGEEGEEAYPWLMWGELISKARSLLKKVMQSDLGKFKEGLV